MNRDNGDHKTTNVSVTISDGNEYFQLGNVSICTFEFRLHSRSCWYKRQCRSRISEKIKKHIYRDEPK